MSGPAHSRPDGHPGSVGVPTPRAFGARRLSWKLKIESVGGGLVATCVGSGGGTRRGAGEPGAKTCVWGRGGARLVLPDE